MESFPIFAVTVTYGQRRSLLEQMLTATLAEGVQDIVIVDNGADWNLAELLPLYPRARLHFVSMEMNQGSAAGFSAGISAAMQAGAEMLWLLDDDNRPSFGALAVLLAVYKREAQSIDVARLATLAYRPDHQAGVAMGLPSRRVNVRRDSFCGFHALDVPYKFWSRTRWGRRSSVVPNVMYLQVAPYSGLLFHRQLISAIGLPNASLVLYADDTEFTWRVTEMGGRIALVTSALVEDLESSWNIKARFANSFFGWLEGVGDFRAYYGMRNQSYIDHQHRCQFRSIFFLNRQLYLVLLRLFALRLGRWSRYQLLRAAIDDGLNGRLGVNPNFPLP
ncbi:glycosyltransferase [Dyella sp.]|uniref:glycosyltransferase n=1 Tax=Dyella sp. TaxID=1869338 RepID=UPI002D796C6E|nr:glycosyltransferase [Dyella sp.]HET7331975.1 glycosyltransferase [Dyella sp.]